MQTKRLESNVNENIVHEEIEILTQILLKATEKMTSKETFNKIIELKRLADNKEYEQLNKIIKSLNQEEMEIVANFFSTLPLLINISEDVDLAYEINYKNNSGETYVGKLSDSISKIKDINILENISPEIVVHRLTGDGDRETLVAPLWSIKKIDVLNSIHKEFKRY